MINENIRHVSTGDTCHLGIIRIRFGTLQEATLNVDFLYRPLNTLQKEHSFLTGFTIAFKMVVYENSIDVLWTENYDGTRKKFS